ncbi:pyrroline-5-carboxylate reductase [Croceicoccus mobilis]|uniref:Pyrroline-5-carboxylate reductase n=1 Tax=Croceicoccus mobilis TaxID=1703339 RepID=A0A917DTW9_9SPHN|nr:pyrroline-5-carboxylate reductase [Croceicoccus mobilis]GGD70017.1 pyrroline-5-carboxylate reductase [Croceicoccus mobilis]
MNTEITGSDRIAQSNGRVLLVGCGNMGFAMLRGWIEKGIPANRIDVVEPNDDLRKRAASTGASVHASAEDMTGGEAPAMAIMAVKPQVMAKVLESYRGFATRGTTFVSVAAGTLIETIEKALGGKPSVIRCMPNTPAFIGEGMMVCVANEKVEDADKAQCETLLSAGGKVAFVEEESMMDAVTGVSGSGPAYVFHFIESLSAAGAAAGLPPELSEELAIQTVYGAAKLAREADEDPTQLRKNVTSPNGTTAAGLSVMMTDDRLRTMIEEVVNAAADRSRELAKD